MKKDHDDYKKDEEDKGEEEVGEEGKEEVDCHCTDVETEAE